MAKKSGTKPKLKSKPQPVAKKPTAPIKAAAKAAAKSPAIKTPVVKAPLIKAVATKPVASKPVASKPAVAKSSPAKPAVVAKPVTNGKAVAKSNGKPATTAKPQFAATNKAAGKAVKKEPESDAKIKIFVRPGTIMLTPAVKSGSSAVAVKPAKLLGKIKKSKLARIKVDDTPVRLPPPPVTSDSKMAKNRAGLTSKELEFFRDLLLGKRRELLGDVTSMEREALRSGNTNLSNLPLHMADTGTDNYEQEFTLGLVEKDRQLLREINTALAKVQDGSYGVCEGTGKPIAKPRLEAQPWAKYSIEHARALEKPQYRRAY